MIGSGRNKTRPGLLNFVMGRFKALRWQRLPEMERLGDFLLKHIEGIAAYCDHPVRFGVVESINTTIKADPQGARGMRDEEMLLLKLKWAAAGERRWKDAFRTAWQNAVAKAGIPDYPCPICGTNTEAG